MFWRHDLASSGVGNSSAALVERAPYNDAEESEPVEGRSREIQRTLTAPLPGDDPHPKLCPMCGMLPIALSLPHLSKSDCISDLRSRLGEKELRAWRGPRLGGRKRRAAARHNPKRVFSI
jgi:hypothetical protein